MLEMKRLQDGKQKSALLTELGVDTSEVFVYAAYEGGNQIGYAVFDATRGAAKLSSFVNIREQKQKAGGNFHPAF